VDEYPALGLGPIAVDPGHQRRGVGSALMHEAIERASRTEYPLIALLGHPTYYPRFGFRPAAETFGVTTHYEAPPEVWMALPLPAYEPHIRGAFRYAPAFGD
jgi:putative acetyltransferase